MKTATMPSLRVNPELRQAAEAVLNENETLSSFMETSLRAGVEYRRLQREFIARGMASREDAKRTGEYFEAHDVHTELAELLQDARAAAQQR